MKETSTLLGEHVRKRRIDLGLTQVELAVKANVTQNTVSLLETEPILIIDTKERITIYNILGIDYRQYLVDKPTKTNFGAFIRNLRKKINLSPREVAERVGISLFEYKDLETTENPFLCYVRMRRLVTVLGGNREEWSKFCKYPTESDTHSKIGAFVRNRRKSLGLSCEDLAQKLGVSRQAVSYVELKGVFKRTNPERIILWANALEVEAEEFSSHI